MVQLSANKLVQETPERRSFASAADAALGAGMSLEQLMSTLTTTYDEYLARQDCLPGFLEPESEPVYDEVPPGLIDLPSIVRDKGIKRSTLNNWLLSGKLSSHGRLRGSARGGGYILVSEEELAAAVAAPRQKGGRPKKP